MKLIRIYKVPYVIKRSVSSFHFDEKSLIIYEKEKKKKINKVKSLFRETYLRTAQS